MMTDPLGDMLTRIRNGQMARKSTVTAPASRLRSNVLEVLQARGLHPRFQPAGCAPRRERAQYRAQISRRRAGDPCHRSDFEAGSAGLFEDQRPAARLERAWHFDLVDAARRDVRCRGPRRQCRRRSPLQSVLEETARMSRVGKYPVAVPQRRHRQPRRAGTLGEGQARHVHAAPHRSGRGQDRGRSRVW